MDADMDNTYMVTVNGHGRHVHGNSDVTVTVTNVNEAGEVTLSTEQPRVGTEIMATLTDVDGMLSSVTWQWTSSSDMSTWTAILNATSNVYTPVDADAAAICRRRRCTRTDTAPTRAKWRNRHSR